jgi:hypothetical protein
MVDNQASMPTMRAPLADVSLDNVALLATRPHG